MLTAYFDESMENGDGHVVVAGFMGNKSSWVRCVRIWRRVLKKHGRTSIHLKELRFNGDRHKELLSDLGKIPAQCGLRLIYGAVNVGAYKPAIAGTVMEVASAGYIFAFQIALLSALWKTPKGQRLEVVCEHQLEFNARRDNVCIACSMMPAHQNLSGTSKLAKWSSVPKSTILEPSDFLAFAILKKLTESNGIKAKLCEPIFDNKLHHGKIMTAKRSNEILAECLAEDPSFAQAILTPEAKKAFIKQLPFGEDFKKQMADFIEETKAKK
jgi:hypothetical protein